MARRGWGDDAIYWVARRKRYVGAASLGYGPDGRRVRRVVSGKTKQEVKDKLKVRSASPGWAWSGRYGMRRRTIS